MRATPATMPRVLARQTQARARGCAHSRRTVCCPTFWKSSSSRKRSGPRAISGSDATKGLRASSRWAWVVAARQTSHASAATVATTTMSAKGPDCQERSSVADAPLSAVSAAMPRRSPTANVSPAFRRGPDERLRRNGMDSRNRPVPAVARARSATGSPTSCSPSRTAASPPPIATSARRGETNRERGAARNAVRNRRRA